VAVFPLPRPGGQGRKHSQRPTEQPVNTTQTSMPGLQRPSRGPWAMVLATSGDHARNTTAVNAGALMSPAGKMSCERSKIGYPSKAARLASYIRKLLNLAVTLADSPPRTGSSRPLQIRWVLRGARTVTYIALRPTCRGCQIIRVLKDHGKNVAIGGPQRNFIFR
jgi:hypothetical protein